MQFQAERDGSNEFANYQPGSLNTTDRLVEDLDNYDIVFHIGDLPYANGYISQWDQFTAQVAPITAKKPYMIARLVPVIVQCSDKLNKCSGICSYSFGIFVSIDAAVTMRGTGPTPEGSSTSRTPAASAAFRQRPCTTTRPRIEPTSGTFRSPLLYISFHVWGGHKSLWISQMVYLKKKINLWI